MPYTFYAQPKRFTQYAIEKRGELLATAYNYIEPDAKGIRDFVEYSSADFTVTDFHSADRVCVVMRLPEPTMPRCKNHSSVYRAWGFPQARSGAAVELSMLSGEAYKVYVSVFVEHRSDGTMLPREIIWEDGQKYEIDRVIDIRPAYAAKAGGQGDRYTIQVNGARTYLYFERSTNLTGNTIGRWFVERKVPLRDLL